MSFSQKFFNHLIKTFVFIVFLSVLCLLLRLAFVIYIGCFHQALWADGAVENLASQILLMLYNGSLYDFQAISAFAILYFLFGMFGLLFGMIKKPLAPPPISGFKSLSFLNGFAYFTFGLFLFLGIANFTYYTIYNDVFNLILLGIFFDDQKAILQDGLSGKYYLSLKFLGFFLSWWIYSKIFAWIVQKINFTLYLSRIKILLCNLGLLGIFILWMIVYINSGFHLSGKSLAQELTPPKNLFLRKITPSAFRSLYIVYKGYRSGKESSFASFTTQTPQEATKDFFGLQNQAPYDLKTLLAQTSTKPDGTPKIDHIFYIVAESLGEYAFHSSYDEIGLMSGLKSLIDNQKGFRVENFFENAHGTVWSMESQISGLYYTGVRLTHKATGLRELPTAVAANFKRAGFETIFHCGTSGDWQNIESFAKSQGFDMFFDTSVYESFAKQKNYTSPYRNVWGVWDSVMFDYISDSLQERQKPTFHMILTTTFHGPMNLPWSYIQSSGGIKEKFEKFSKENPRWGALDIATLWWVDKNITNFIQNVSAKYPNSLFVVTGDHTHYGYVNGFQDSREVPMVIYSPSLKIKPIADVGSHLDIAPTLLNLATPKQFTFYSFGKPLFSADLNTPFDEKRSFIGFELAGNAKEIYTIHHQSINLQTSKITQDIDDEGQKFLQRLKEAQALSWYLFTKGEIIP